MVGIFAKFAVFLCYSASRSLLRLSEVSLLFCGISGLFSWGISTPMAKTPHKTPSFAIILTSAWTCFALTVHVPFSTSLLFLKAAVKNSTFPTLAVTVVYRMVFWDCCWEGNIRSLWVLLVISICCSYLRVL